ncbi:hypothetical protein B0H11DRAFT_2012988 [Mycena galericulata]|nr:hypothetical protein B0H11DRAFT_2012988 [Mycena galericulata]
MPRTRPNHRGGKWKQVTQDVEAAAKKGLKPRIKHSTSEKPRDPRRGRSEEAFKKHRQKYTSPGGAFDNGQNYWLQQIETVTVASYPTHFLGGDKDGTRVVAVVREEFPGNPADLPAFSADDSKILLVSTRPPTTEESALSGVGGIAKWLEPKLCLRVRAAFKKLGPPPFEIGRFPDVISDYAQYELLRAWDRVQALQPVYPPVEMQRSSAPGLHLGIWERYTTRPIITGDSRQIQAPLHRRKELMDALHDLCGVIQRFVMPKLRSIVEWYYPGLEWMWEAMHQRILKHLGRELAQYPNFDFGGLITTVACKEGGSEKIHIDWFDNLNLHAWVLAIGDFQGASFCTPQLGGQTPCKPGSLLGARTRFLAHCCTPISGRRLVFTFFTDSCLFEKTMRKLH